MLSSFGGGSGKHPQDLIFFLLALLVVFPDTFLNWISERTEWTITWAHYVVFEVFAVGLIIATFIILNEFGLRVNEWIPFISIGVLAILRFLFWVIAREMSNFEDEYK